MNSKECKFITFNIIHRSHGEGNFYMLPEKFPFILHDKSGCIFIDEKLFNNLKSLDCIRISHSKNGDKINITKNKNISQLNGYIKCDSAEECPKAKFKK